MSMKKQLIEDLKVLGKECAICNGKISEPHHKWKEKRVYYLDNSLFQIRYKPVLRDLLNGFSILPTRNKTKQKVIVIEDIAEEARPVWERVLEKGDIEDRLFYQNVFSEEGKIVHPRIDVKDFVIGSPYEKAADDYFGLMQYRRGFLEFLEEEAIRKNKDIPNLEEIIKKTREDFHNKFGIRLYSLCKKGKNGKLVDEKLVLNFLFDAATNDADYFLLTDDPDISDQFIKCYHQLCTDVVSYNFAKRYKENPNKYKIAHQCNDAHFFIAVPEEELDDLRYREGRKNMVAVWDAKCIHHDGAIMNVSYLRNDCDEFLKIKSETGRNTNLFGDFNCTMTKGKDGKGYAYFFKDVKARNEINDIILIPYLTQDWVKLRKNK